MSRRRQSKKRVLIAEDKYNSVIVHMIINRVMKDGKKELARRIVYGMMDEIKLETNKEPALIIEQAVNNIRPTIEVKARRVGGSALQIPLEVKLERGTVLAIQWILAAARNRPGSQIMTKLKYEIIDAFNQTGSAMKKRTEIQRMAEANKAFAKFRF